MKRIIIILLILGVNLSADNLHRLSIRGSMGSFWNEGWQDKFYFHTLSYEELLRGYKNFNKTLRHNLYPNPEVWYTIPISGQFSLSLCARYEKLKFDLYDGVLFSYMIYDKWLKADLDLYSVGVRLQWNFYRTVKPYMGFSAGYGHGNLKTIQDYESPSVFITHVEVSGDGEGFFYDLVAGAEIPIISNFRGFVEGDFRFTPGWKKFALDDIQSEGLNDWVPWLPGEDRRLDPFTGWILRLGLSIGIF